MGVLIFSLSLTGLTMNNTRQFNILVWNIRGINSQAKWDAIRAKIAESSCQVLCLQETKRELFDSLYLKKFCPKHLNCFAFSPSVGASGGIITIWNGKIFDGTVVHSNGYYVTMKFVNKLDRTAFHLSNVYGPSQAEAKMGFITWLLNTDSDDLDDWIIAGDFILYRSIDDRKNQVETSMKCSYLTISSLLLIELNSLLMADPSPGVICSLTLC
jgi:exonuclease III